MCIFNFQGEFSGIRGFQDHPEGLGERQHCHGLGQGFDNFLLSAYDICL